MSFLFWFNQIFEEKKLLVVLLISRKSVWEVEFYTFSWRNMLQLLTKYFTILGKFSYAPLKIITLPPIYKATYYSHYSYLATTFCHIFSSIFNFSVFCAFFTEKNGAWSQNSDVLSDMGRIQRFQEIYWFHRVEGSTSSRFG